MDPQLCVECAAEISFGTRGVLVKSPILFDRPSHDGTAAELGSETGSAKQARATGGGHPNGSTYAGSEAAGQHVARNAQGWTFVG